MLIQFGMANLIDQTSQKIISQWRMENWERILDKLRATVRQMPTVIMIAKCGRRSTHFCQVFELRHLQWVTTAFASEGLFRRRVHLPQKRPSSDESHLKVNVTLQGAA